MNPFLWYLSKGFLRGTLCSHPSPTGPPLQEYSVFPASLLLFPFLTSISVFLTNHWQEFPPTHSRSKDRRLLGSAGLMKAIQLPLKATGWTQCLEWMRNLMKICGMKESINEIHQALCYQGCGLFEEIENINWMTEKYFQNNFLSNK